MLAPRGAGIVLEPEFDWRVLAFTAVIAAVATLLFSLAPALHATRGDAAKPALTGATAAARPRMLRQTLVVVQIALSVALLCGATLFGSTLRNLYSIDAGFQQTQILTMQVAATLPAVTEAPRTPERRAVHARVGAIWEAAIARVRALPGVASAGVATMSPLTGRDRGVLIRYPGPPLPDQDRYIHINQITAGFIETMDIEVVAGRTIMESDRGGAPRVALLNQSAASKYFGGPSGALGRQIMFPGQMVEDPYAVVGVVRDVRYENLRTPDERMAYLPIEQSLEPITEAMVVIRSQGDTRSVLPLVRDTAAAALPGGFVSRVATMDERLEASLLRERLLSLFTSFFGGVALVLAWIGLYGVMSYAVISRAREIATHIAIGAPSGSVVRMVVGEILALVAIGAVLGTAIALAGGRYIRSQLFNIVPGDPAAIALALLFLLTVTAAAAYLPARRAARIDPVLVLRTE
jgi:predicted permease